MAQGNAINTSENGLLAIQLQPPVKDLNTNFSCANSACGGCRSEFLSELKKSASICGKEGLSQTLADSPLADIKSGQKAMVLAYTMENSFVNRLRELGIYEGAIVTVIQGGDSMVVNPGNSRIVLGKEITSRIEAELV